MAFMADRRSHEELARQLQGTVVSPLPQDPATQSRTVLTDLPDQLAVLPGEAELLHHHLRGCLAELFGSDARRGLTELITDDDDRR